MEKRNYQVDNYLNKKRKNAIMTMAFGIILIILFITSLLVGQYGVSAVEIIKIMFGKSNVDAQTLETISTIVYKIRLPRTIASVLIGTALSIAGLTYQCVFRNMLVSQDVLGVSTGACVGAALAIVMNLSVVYIQGLSFVFGIGTVVIVFVLSGFFKTEKTLSLILSGVLVSGLMSSILGYIKYTANSETQLQNIIYWIMGDVSSVTLKQINQIIIPTMICAILIYINRWKLNFFGYSDVEATSMGMKIKVYRVLFIVCATMLVSMSVSISGSIGWIGLVIPQLVRTLVGTDNLDTCLVAVFLGADFMLLVDIINRLISTAELPVSILTGIIGTPLFVICLFLKQRGGSYHAED